MKKEDFDCRIIDVDITDNEVIARFIGAEVKPIDQNAVRGSVFYNGEWYRDFSRLKFQTSFDWLMPVWYKFRDLVLTTQDDHVTHSNHRIVIGSAILSKGIGEACKLLAEGIRWYNSTQNKEKV